MWCSPVRLSLHEPVELQPEDGGTLYIKDSRKFEKSDSALASPRYKVWAKSERDVISASLLSPWLESFWWWHFCSGKLVLMELNRQSKWFKTLVMGKRLKLNSTETNGGKVFKHWGELVDSIWRMWMGRLVSRVWVHLCLLIGTYQSQAPTLP